MQRPVLNDATHPPEGTSGLPSDRGAGRQRERGLDRALDIFETLRRARRPLRPSEIARDLDAPRSTVTEIVRTLIARGYIERAGGDGRVQLGRRIYLLGMAQADGDDALARAEAALASIAHETGELAQYCALDGDKYVVLRQRESAQPFRISADIGARVPIPWTASGRLLVSDLSAAEIAVLIPPADFQLPSGRSIAPACFAAQAAQAQAAGHYTCDSVVDTFTHCFAVPVLSGVGRVVATLCLVAPIENARRNRAAYLSCLKARAAALTDPA